MISVVRGRHLTAVTAAATSLMCVLLASAFLLSAVGFGLESGEMDGNPEPHLLMQARLKRAGNLAAAGFVVLEIAATWLLMKWLAAGVLGKLRVGLRAVATFVSVSLFSWSIVLLALFGFYSDPLIVTQSAISAWIMGVSR